MADPLAAQLAVVPRPDDLADRSTNSRLGEAQWDIFFSSSHDLLSNPQVLMAQGPVKSKGKSKPARGPHTHPGVTKKGSRAIRPKKASLVRQAKLNKKLAGSLIVDTEKMLGARAGHLEMLGGSKERAKKDPALKFKGKSKSVPEK